MDFRKLAFITPLIAVGLLLALPGFSTEVSAGEPVVLRGTINSVAHDFTFMVIKNDVKVHLTSNTKLSDEKGQPFSLEKLKPGNSVAVEASESGGELRANKIALKKKKGV